MLRGGLAGDPDRLSGVEPGIGDPDLGDADRGPDEPVAVEIKKPDRFLVFHGHSFSTQA